jgi:Secretion system C-terminal sorting domain
MSKKIQLTIPKPCHENWDAMTDLQKGKFCGSCQKQVVDFTNMSDRQLAEFFKKPSTGSVCGRFMTDQLERELEIPKKRIPWVKYFFTIALPALFISKVSAQQKPKMGKVMMPSLRDTVNMQVVPQVRMLGMVAPRIEPLDKVKIDSTQENKRISGRVVNEMGEAVAFATIETGQTAKFFSIEKNVANQASKLVVSSIGYETKELEFEKIHGSITIALNTNIVLQEVVVSPQGLRIGCSSITMGMPLVKGEVLIENKNSKVEVPQTSKKVEMESAIKIHPNPVKGGNGVNIQLQELPGGYYNMDVVNISGQSIKQNEIWIDAEARIITIEIPNISAGTYFITLTNKATGKRLAEKILVQ